MDQKSPTTDSFPQTGIVVPDKDQKLDVMGEWVFSIFCNMIKGCCLEKFQRLTPLQAHAVLDDIISNTIFDLVLSTHREEKLARASSAAIIVEQKAAQSDPNITDDASTSDTVNTHRVETEAAVYENGQVFLKGNPLKTISEIRCPKCGLPRLLHPTDGRGARKPTLGVEYCKKHPFIDKPHVDIYGQTFKPEGPGRGKKKKDQVDQTKLQTAKEDTPAGSQESPNPSPPPNEDPTKPIPFPHAKCRNCNTFMPIKRMNNHMAKCIGGLGRDSSRNALLKIQNGNGNGSQSGHTPHTSRNSTPVPSNPASSKNRSSPNKRDATDDLDSEESPQKKVKLKLKKTATTKLKATAPKMQKSASQHSASNLSFEQKAPQSDEEEDDGGDDDGTGEYGNSIQVQKPKKKPNPVEKKQPVKKSKWKYNNKGGIGSDSPSVILPDTAIKLKLKRETNGKSGMRDESESSQTLSSPN
jgi:hypothetical protein